MILGSRQRFSVLMIAHKKCSNTEAHTDTDVLKLNA